MPLVDQQQQQEAAPPEVQELPPQVDPSSWEFVRAQVATIQPGDSVRLAIFLQTYPGFRDRILGEAQQLLGNATVQAALAGNAAAASDHGTLTPADRAAAMAVYAPDGSGATGTMSSDDRAAAMATYAPEGAGATGAAPDDATRAELAATADGKDAAAPDAAPSATGRGQAPDPNAWENIELLLSVDDIQPEQLATLLKAHPQFRERIITTAQASMTPEAIAQALRIADAPPPGAEAQEAPAQVPGESGPAPGAQPGAQQQAAPEPEKEPAWVGRARAWNDANFDLVEEFNALTEGACMSPGLDGGMTLDPNKIADWQKANGVPPDGRIGAHTVDAARTLHKPASGNAAQTDDVADQIGDEVNAQLQ